MKDISLSDFLVMSQVKRDEKDERSDIMFGYLNTLLGRLHTYRAIHEGRMEQHLIDVEYQGA